MIIIGERMNIVLLSGGSGSRLWPLSNEVRSKQFLKIFKKEDGTKESMVQRVYRKIHSIYSDANILIATFDSQVPQIKEALGDDIEISIEPCRRDTFPAILLAVTSLRNKGVSVEEPVIISPVDPYVNDDYFEMFGKMESVCDNANITLMGIKPTYPSEKYGYILPNGSFVEKPDKKRAQELIDAGALWNSGVYCFKIKYILSKAKEILGYDNYDSIFKNYDKLKRISIDYAVAENEKSIQVISFGGEWKDLGTWNTLTEAMSENVTGEATIVDCNNTHVVNELLVPLVSIGVDNVIIAATPDGILVSDKEKSTKVKELVKSNRPMYEKRTWGEYRVLDYKNNGNNCNSLTKELVIKAGQHISYQYHMHRTEVWTFVGGSGYLVIDGEKRHVSFGDNIVIKSGVKHAVKAETELHIIEVQLGDELIEDDIVRLDYDWS